MAGSVASKRHRSDDAEMEEMGVGEDQLKRQKSFNQIISLLDEEEDEPNQDLSSIITTLQQEIISTTSSSSLDPNQQCHETDQNNQETTAGSATAEGYTTSSSSSSSFSSSATSPVSKVDEDGERERMMRHLLEASDDELGIPNGEFLVEEGVDGIDRSGGLSLCDAFWELEDEAANYYTLFQSQLFM